MKFRKIPVSITDQITLLKSRGMVFHNEALAQAFLSAVSYYRLRAYTYPFQDNANPDHPFIKPVSFEEIIQPNNDFKDQVIGLMGTCPLVHEKEMGVPPDWKEEPLWK